jgi:hypothetical protein
MSCTIIFHNVLWDDDHTLQDCYNALQTYSVDKGRRFRLFHDDNDILMAFSAGIERRPENECDGVRSVYRSPV